MHKGKFVVIDGPDGSGKGTEIQLLKRESLLKKAVFTHEPGATKRGEEIRKLLLARGGSPSIYDFFLFWAARTAHVEEVIMPALRAGKNVIADRFDSSTFAYQLVADGRPELFPLFKKCREAILGRCVPDAYIFLDLPVSIAMKRLKSDKTKRTKYDVMPASYHEKVRRGFRKFAKATGAKVFVVDASRSPEEVHKDMLEILRATLH